MRHINFQIMTKQTLNKLAEKNIFDLIGRDWMLITAGSVEKFNTMTASWGGLGWLWNKPVAFIFIRQERYTYEFIESSDRVTLSFYPEEMRNALQTCGTLSGRDCNKVEKAGLTPHVLESGGVTFKEASMTLDCRKLFKTEIDEEGFVDREILGKWYGKQQGGSFHSVYVVEIEEILP